MINGSLLWKQRFVHYGHEMKRYLRYMFNDHLLFILLVGIGGGAVVYQHWIERLPPHFPYAFVAALVFSLF
jgi:ABC-2 type transport system permease protein